MRRFTALYTHQKQKKSKTWQDGFAHFNTESNDIVVFDSSNQRIASYRLRAREKIELSSEYDIGRYLLTLEEEERQCDKEDAGRDDSAAKEKSSDLQSQAPTSLARTVLKRTRRLPSLVKPMKPKSAGKDASASISDPCAQPDDGPIPCPAARAESDVANCTEYAILYTTQKVKKVKAWVDGTMAFYPEDHRTLIKSEDGQVLSSTFLQRSKKIEVGCELDIGIYLVQVEGLKSDKDSCASGVAAENPGGSQLSKALKRRYEAIQEGGTLRSPLAGTKRNGAALPKPHKKISDASDISNTADPAISISATGPIAAAIPSLKRAQSSGVSSTRSDGSRKSDVSQLSATGPAPKRAAFVPPAPQVPKHLHFPRRGELLQHVSVGKGYSIGPPRQLTAPVRFSDWKHYVSAFSALLRENLMVELSLLAIRYFFMAREKHQNASQRAEASDGSRGRRGGFKRGAFGSKRGFGAGGSLAQVCKSLGVMYFEDCTLRQPFLDGKAFRAQASTGSVRFAKGDSVTIELSRRENNAGFAKDDTWAISTSADFATDTTFLARSAFFGPSKNNTLELVIAGDEDAKAAMRIFNETAAPKKPGQFEKAAPTVVAIRCLDSASDWTMIDTVEEMLNPESLPLLPHLLGDAANDSASQAEPGSDMVLERIGAILSDKRQELGLNDEQYAVLEQVVMSAVSIYVPIPDARPVTIVHGPFGTGKSFLVAAVTITLDAIASEFPDIFDSRSSEDALLGEQMDGSANSGRGKQEAGKRPPRLRVLVSSMTNFAVDNMLEALLKQGYDEFLRVGNLKRISKRILPYVCRSSASATDDIKELEAMLEAAEAEDEQDAISTAIQRVRQQQSQDTLESAFVVGTTCLSAATAAIRGSAYPVVILDEACQIVEPMALIALASAGCRRVVLVGDPLQLPPTLTTRAAKASEGNGLDRALFDRLVQMGHRPRFLATQFRCHPRIAALCNELFYSGRLRHGISASDRLPLVSGIPPLAFLDVAGQERQHGRSQSFFNKSEIDMVVLLVRHLLLASVKPESIGVIALYKTQSDMLREQLAQTLGQRTRVQVSTVDAYQGSERDIIIISCVRTEKIGFISNPNRVNVALSRARNHCLVLGSRKLLETNPMWRKIVEYCRADGGPMGVCPAQAFVNRMSETIVAENAQSDGDIAYGGFDKDMYVASDSRSADENAGSQGLGFDEMDDLDDADNGADIEEYADDSVIGGALSQQWSLSAFDNSFFDSTDVANCGGSNDINYCSDDGADIIDCLDVDLDEM